MFQRVISGTTTMRARPIVRVSYARWLHASPIASKTATEKVAEVADKINKSVGQGLASAIDKGEQVTEKTKQTFDATKDKVAGNAKSASGKVKEKSNSAAEKASEMASKAKKRDSESPN